MMKRIILITLLVLSFHVVSATDNDSKGRMLRYATLHRLFDAPLSPLGINEISQMLAVDSWDFDSFSGYILQEIPKMNGVSPVECSSDSASRTLIIPYNDDSNLSCSLSSGELEIKFMEDVNNGDRSMSVSHKMVATKMPLAELRKKCVDLLADFEVTESDGLLSYEGFYGHTYTVIEDVDEKTITFSCRMPIPAYKWYNVPAGYIPAIAYNELPDYAPCNQGEESFNKFLNRFNTDSVFRVERRNLSDMANHADREDGYDLPIQFDFNEFVLKALDESGLMPISGHYEHKDYKSTSGEQFDEYNESCGQWFFPTQNSVIYSGWNTSSEHYEDDCGIIILFERVDGEWNTTATWYNGVKFDNIVKRLMHEAFDE